MKGVIFDFDGVIGDTERLQYLKWNILLKPFGIEISPCEYIEKYCGKSSATEIPWLLKRRYPKIIISEEEMAKRASQILKELFKKKARLIPGALRALNWFKKKGFKMAVCSGKDPKELEMKIDSLQLASWFPPENRVSEAEAAGKPKPDPAMYLLACQRIGLLPNECLAFEDTEIGVEAATKAGLYVIALPNKWTKD